MSLMGKAFLGVLLLIGTSLELKAAELIMTDLRGCPYCARFHRELGREYPLSQAGQIAPLRRVSPLKKWPADLANIKPAHHTPVFILVERGQEVGRFFGYADRETFWLKLNPLLAQLTGTPPVTDPFGESRAGLF